MKPDGVTMETTEPTEAAAEAEPSVSQDNITEQQTPSQPEQATNDAAPDAAPKTNGKPVAAEPKVKPQGVASKIQATTKTAGTSGSNSRPGAASHRTMNNVQSNSSSAKTTSARKTAATTTAKASASAAGAVPKRPARVAAVSSTAKNQTRVPDKKPVGPTRTTSVAAATANGTKTTVNGAPKRRTAAETVNAARPKSMATPSRPASSTALKPSTSTAAKAESGAISKTTRTALGPSSSRPASSTSRPTTAATKPSTTATAKTAASRVTTAPSTGRTTAAQPPKTAAAKKDVSRPPLAAGAKRPATGTTSAAAKVPDSSKPSATTKLNSASKWSATTKVADPKMSQPKIQQPAKSTPAKKPGVAPARFNANNKLPIGRTPPASPANKPGSSSSTPQAKRGTKPTQAVPPFTATKKTGVSNTTTSVEAQSAARAGVAGRTAAAAVAAAGAAAAAAAAAVGAAVATAPAATVLADVQAETTVALPQEPSIAVCAPEEVPPQALTENIPPEVTPQETVQSHPAAPSPPQSPVRTALPVTAPPQEQLESSVPSLITEEPVSVPAEPTSPPVASPPELSEEPVYLLTDQTPSVSKALPAAAAAAAAAAAIPQLVPPTNLNEEEYEEEREGSLPVSLSEMSGTTQPTEESRPGSAGPVGGSAWRAGGALLSELDSEDVSGSQLGASELSAPGVLEGAESMDDLGDGSLKGASAGSPDFEKVPDIPVNDFEEDDDEDEDDDNDRVCDMDVGSERIDEPQRPRHDNDVEDEEEDEDVEMASEGVTESGLESYGNADEDDFAEDERLDNLNRVAQPPPPPQLPSAPAAQWDQQNPFADHWAEPLQPLQPQQLLGHVSQPAQAAGAAAASPLVDLWQADSETPTQSPAQPWLELGTAPFVPENQQVFPHSSVKDGAQMYMDQPGLAPMQTLAPAQLSAPGMSLSSTLSSDTSTPEELRDYNGEGKVQPQDTRAPVLSPQLDLDDQDLGIHMERGDGEGEEDAEAETLPADEVLGGPATAPTSNPSSSSVTEDEASDTEGEAQLDDSLESPAVTHITFDNQPASQRCLSTVEEGEEADMVESVVGEDRTPPSATSLASYGFDTMTTASSSNAQSTGESCIKSPGIFSLEELPEEAKDPCLIPQPLSQPCLAEQQYIECGKQEAESAEHAGEEVLGSEEAPDPSAALSTLQQPEENPDDMQPPYYSAICEKTENSFAGFTALPHAHRRDHSAHPRTYCDIVKPIIAAAAAAPPRLTCADLPPRNVGQQALSPQLRRLEQHQRQLQELQQRREQQSRPLEEAEQERKRREEEEQRKKKEEAEEEIKRNKEEEERKAREQVEATKKEEEEKQRRDLEMQLQQQQEELKQRQQIMQWQQELQQSNKGQTVLLSPSSGLCTIYEALENSDEEANGEEEEEEEEGIKELKPTKEEEEEEPRQETPNQETDDSCERVASDVEEHRDSSPSNETPPPHPDSPRTPSNLSQDGDSSSPPQSPERPPPLDLDWGKKVDIVQQLINQTLLLNGDGCSSLLLLPGGAGGTLSPLESSLWPSLLPPLTPPSATVTSVSSFSPEATGSSPQGEWTVVELETHH